MQGSPRGWTAALGLAVAILIGVILRLTWVTDIEYKGDEAWTFVHTQQRDGTAAISWLGMGSSAGPRNPGMSLWVFQVLSKLSGAHDPTALARSVQLLSVAAILVLLWFAWRYVPSEEREPWLWSVAFLSVNPLAVLFHRKIWPPSVAPIFVSVMLIAWWNRQRFWWALVWGLLGACLGQIHMAGFFFAAGFVAWAWLFDRKQVDWRGWLIGSFVGSLPLVPWLRYLANDLPHRPTMPFKWWHAVEGRFWLRWVSEPLGWGLDYSLDRDFGAFLSAPVLWGQPTYLVGVFQGLALAVGAFILFRAGVRSWNSCRADVNGNPGNRQRSPTAFTLSAACLGFGLLITLSCLPVHRCYMIFAYPFEFLWLARLALGAHSHSAQALRNGRVLLGTLCVAQCLISASFLGYVHVHQAIQGDYGVAYGAQTSPPPLPQDD